MDRYWLAICVPVLLILLMTCALFIEAKNDEARQVEQTFLHDVQTHLSLLERNFLPYFNTVFAIHSFFNSSVQVDRDEFRAFVTHSLTTQPGILALEWVPVVPQDERSAYEQLAKQEGYPSFQFKRWQNDTWVESSEAWAEYYYPVYYLEPYVGNEMAMGIDLGSSEVRRAALLEARDTNQLVATSPINLAQDETKQSVGVLLILPTYKPRSPVSTVGERRENILGFILVVLRFEDIIQNSLQGIASNGLLLTVTDETAVANKILYDEIGENQPTENLQYVQEYTVGGRQWRAEVRASSDYTAAVRTEKPFFILIGGIILATAIGTLIWGIGTRMRMLDQIIAKNNQLEIANSELLNISTKLANSKRVLERSNQELKQFAYVASHDLQEPLRTVSSFVQLLSRRYKGELDEDADEYIEFAVNGIARMKQLINDLLKYSQLDKHDQEKHLVDLDKVVSHVCHILSLRIEETKTRIDCEELPIIIGVESQLIQLFQNLVCNAIKFRQKDRPPHIKISVDQDGDEWLFSVADNGIGFDLHFSDRIFRIFRRLHHQQEYSGTGIGLAICKKVVERHGGLIWVHSYPGEGTTFSFTLPIVKGNQHDEPEFQQTDRDPISRRQPR